MSPAIFTTCFLCFLTENITWSWHLLKFWSHQPPTPQMESEKPDGWNALKASTTWMELCTYLRSSFHVMSYIILIGRSWRIRASFQFYSPEICTQIAEISSSVGQSALEIKKLDRRIWVKFAFIIRSSLLFIQDVGAVDINLLGHRL